MQEAKVTVILPTYRRPWLLQRALRSLQTQTLREVKVCIYDNASGDETRSVAERFCKRDSRFEYLEHAHNIGSIENFNFGLKHLTTPYFAFLSDDDELFPWCLEELLSLLEHHPKWMCAIGRTCYLETDGSFHLPRQSREHYMDSYEPPQGAEALLRGDFPEWTGGVFKSELSSLVGFLDPESYFCDLDYFLRITTRYPIGILNKPCALFYKHLEAQSFFPNAQTARQGYERILQKIQRQEIWSERLNRLFARRVGNIFFSELLRAVELRAYKIAYSYANNKSFLGAKKRKQDVFLAILVKSSPPKLLSGVAFFLRLRRKIKKWMKHSKAKRKIASYSRNIAETLERCYKGRGDVNSNEPLV